MDTANLSNVFYLSGKNTKQNKNMNMQTSRGVQYVLKTAQYITKFYIYTLYNYFH